MESRAVDGSLVLLKHDDDVAVITFNRPRALNSINVAMSQELGRIASMLPRITARVIVLRGAGSAFMGGGDITDFAATGGMIARLREILENFHAFVLALHEAPQPVVAVVQGAAAGGGLSLVIGCDFSVVAANARLNFGYRRLGASPDGGCTFLLQRLVGRARARDLLLTRDLLVANEAQTLGLISRVAAADELETAVEQLVSTLCANSCTSTAHIKRLLNADLAAFRHHLDAEKDAFLACAARPDFASGVAAFTAKQPPRFTAPPERVRD